MGDAGGYCQILFTNYSEQFTSSDAFLRYIRTQAAEFSKGVSRAMIKHGTYFHVTTSNREDPRTETSCPNMDPRAHRGARPPSEAFNVWATAAASA